jgi:alpha-N-arabinofuranosidase
MLNYRNPVVPGFYPDPSVIRVGEDYFMVNSTFEFFPGVPVLHSRDLVHWRTIGHCLTRKSQLNLDNCPCSRGIWAATIRHHNGIFYMITTIMNPAVNQVPLRKFLVTATDPAGEWSDPIWIDQPGIDPSLLFDEDGSVYLTSNGGAHGQKGINQNLIDVRTGKLLNEDRVIWGGTGGAYPEGPHLYKINGWYYLTIAEGGCQNGHVQTVARSRSPWGPFESYNSNPILTHRHRGGHVIQGLGHCDWVQDTRGNWWSFCLGYRMNRQFFYHLGRETFLAPMSWTSDGWPIIGNNGTIELDMQADLPTPHPWPTDPIRDDFDKPSLGWQWNTLRNAPEGAWSLSESPDALTLHGNAATLNDIAAPAFVGRRQCHWDVTVRTQLDFSPMHDGEESGLTIFYQNEYHYEIAIVRASGNTRLIVRRRIGDLSAVVSDQPAPSGPIILAIKADKLQYQMGYESGGRFVPLATGSTQHLSCEAAPVGFTGVYFAMYATGNGRPAATPARFDWFDYEPTTV